MCIRDSLEAEGWTLEVKEFQDYVQPNNVVESGEFDANYFQHFPYLENFNEEQGTHLSLIHIYLRIIAVRDKADVLTVRLVGVDKIGLARKLPRLGFAELSQREKRPGKPLDVYKRQVLERVHIIEEVKLLEHHAHTRAVLR